MTERPGRPFAGFFLPKKQFLAVRRNIIAANCIIGRLCHRMGGAAWKGARHWRTAGGQAPGAMARVADAPGTIEWPTGALPASPRS